MSFPVATSRHDAVGAWFLGPRAENFKYMKEYFNMIIDDQNNARKNYFPSDKDFITPAMQSSSLFKFNQQMIEGYLEAVSKGLAMTSVPFWSPRYCAHMTMEATMPAYLGYITAMMYNQNNVAIEASPITTLVEEEVGRQLSEMMGFNTQPENKEVPLAWGHITCDGSVANLESIWAARNLKFYPLSLRMACRPKGPLAFISDSFHVTLCVGGKKLFSDCSTWELLNLKPSTILNLPEDLHTQFGISPQFLQTALQDYTIQTLGKETLEKEFDIVRPSQYFVGSTKHYSWPKGAAITGIGSKNSRDVPVDLGARMDPKALDALLKECFDAQQAVYAVVAILGSTEQGAVDPISDIWKLRNKYEELGMTFVIHADGAWGSIFASTLRDPPPSDETSHGNSSDYVPQLALLPYTRNELEYLKYADSVTVDPHKSGYVPYPAGGLCYKDGRMRYLVTWTSPVIYRDNEAGQSIGVYGVEGSKPGAAAVAAWMSQSILGLHKDGYGALLGEAVFTCTRMYCNWVTMDSESPDIVVVPFNMLPVEKGPDPTPQKVEEQKEQIRKLIINQTNMEIMENEEAFELLQELGSDLCINAFACNFRVQGKVNTDVGEANYFNQRLFNRLSIQSPKDDPQTRPMILTSTQLSQKAYGECLRNFKRRLGLNAKGEEDLFILINVVMSPFPTAYNFVKDLANSFMEIAQEEVKPCILRNTPTPAFHGFVMQGTDKLYLVHLPMFCMQNHRYQLTISGTVPPHVMEKYVAARKTDPSAAFILANTEKDFLEHLVEHSGGSFAAVIFKGLPNGSDAKPLIADFNLTNIKVIYNRSLKARDLGAEYPERMPFFLYGTGAQIHLDHQLLRGPNAQLIADQVTVEFLPTNGTISAPPPLDRETPLVAHFESVYERAMQPFVALQNEPAFFTPGATFECVIDDPSSPGARRARITLGKMVYVDVKDLNMDPGAHVKHEESGGPVVAGRAMSAAALDYGDDPNRPSFTSENHAAMQVKTLACDEGIAKDVPARESRDGAAPEQAHAAVAHALALQSMPLTLEGDGDTVVPTAGVHRKIALHNAWAQELNHQLDEHVRNVKLPSKE